MLARRTTAAIFLGACFILCLVDITRRKFQTLLDFTLVGTLPAHALTDQAPGRGSLLTPERLRLPRGAWLTRGFSSQKSYRVPGRVQYQEGLKVKSRNFRHDEKKKKVSPITEKIRDPLYTTFLKISTKKLLQINSFEKRSS